MRHIMILIGILISTHAIAMEPWTPGMTVNRPWCKDTLRITGLVGVHQGNWADYQLPSLSQIRIKSNTVTQYDAIEAYVTDYCNAPDPIKLIGKSSSHPTYLIPLSDPGCVDCKPDNYIMTIWYGTIGDGDEWVYTWHMRRKN